MRSVLRCSICGIDYPYQPTLFERCRVCAGPLSGCSVTTTNADDWEYNVAMATAAPASRDPVLEGEVRISFEVGPDGVERMFVDGADLVRARIAHSHQQLIQMARVDAEVGPHGLPVVTVNGMTLELQGYDASRRRWWAEAYHG